MSMSHYRALVALVTMHMDMAVGIIAALRKQKTFQAVPPL